MKLGSVCIAYNEERFVGPHLDHNPIPDKLVLLSLKPWQGAEDKLDGTERAVAERGVEYLTFPWPAEHAQRNAGQEWFQGFDWIITLDPDEFLTRHDWNVLFRELQNAKGDAYVCERQLTYWKSGYVVSPPEDYKQIIAVRPSVRFFDKRCVDRPYGVLPVTLHHFSWARTDAECLSKITHYAHAHEINPNWYEEVWLKWQPQDENLHPLTPRSLKKAIPCQLPPELAALNLWPTSTSG